MDGGGTLKRVAANLEFSARASAVASNADASANADHTEGVAIFTLAKTGLMFEASIGGQKFSYTEADSSDADDDATASVQ